MPPKSLSHSNAEIEKKQARAQLRESFLRAISEFIGESCSINTFEQSTLSATFAGWNPDGTEFLVQDLKTPSAVKIESALLRTPDILSVEFNHPIELP